MRRRPHGRAPCAQSRDARARAPSSWRRTARSARSANGRATTLGVTRCTRTTRRCSPIRTSTPCSSSRRRRSTPAQIIARARGRQARVLREADVAGARRVPARRGGGREASAAQGDDRLRAPLRPRATATRMRAGRIGRRSASRSWCKSQTDRQARPVRLLREVRAEERRHLPRHERARHRHRALVPAVRPKPVRVFATGTVAVHEGLKRVRRPRQRRRDDRVRGRASMACCRRRARWRTATRRRPRSPAPTGRLTIGAGARLNARRHRRRARHPPRVHADVLRALRGRIRRRAQRVRRRRALRRAVAAVAARRDRGDAHRARDPAVAASRERSVDL